MKRKSSKTFNVVILFIGVQQFTDQNRNIKLAFLPINLFILHTYSFYNYLLLCVRNVQKNIRNSGAEVVVRMPCVIELSFVT